MSLLFDQNLSRRLASLLSDVYPNSEHVASANLSDGDDGEIWSYALSKNLAIVSKDGDFEILSKTRGAPPKVIWLRIGNGPTRIVESLLRARAIDVIAFLADPTLAILELP